MSCFRSVQMQVYLMGFVFFCIPGAFNSIIGLHSGIPQEYTNLGYGILYFVFALSSLVAPALVNKFDPRLMMCIGGCTYTLFSLSLLLAGPLDAIPLPVVTVCAGLIGLGAAVLWSGNGAMLLSYPTENRKASYISTFWVIFNLGAVIGGIQSFATNLQSNDAGAEEAAPVTFIVYIAMNVIGTILVWLLLPLEKVVREDGTHCEKPKSTSPSEELRGMFQMMSSRHVMALLPLFVYSNWFYAYQLGVFSAGVLQPAASGLASALYWGAQMVSAKCLGCLLDAERLTVARRAWVSFGASSVLIAGSWIWAISANSSYGLDLPEEERLLHEYNEPGFMEAAALMTLWGFCDALVQTWCYWVMTLFYTESEDFGRIAGIFKFAQSSGSAASFLIDTAHPSASVQLYINIGLFIVSLPGACYLCTLIPTAKQAETGNRVDEDNKLAQSGKHPTPEAQDVIVTI